MAQIDVSSEVGRLGWLRALAAIRLRRGYNMLLAAALSSLTIVAVAAAMMAQI